MSRAQMALTVPQPASSFDQLGWLFHNSNCYLDASIYHDDDEDIMEFSDSSVEYPSYQTSQHVQQQQVSKFNCNTEINLHP